MKKPRLSKAKQKELAWARDALFKPEEEALPEPIADPMYAAWRYRGLVITASQGYKWFLWRASAKPHVLAVAYLNQQGIPATPKAVTELVGVNVYQVVARKLRWLAGDAGGWYKAQGYVVVNPVLKRVKYGRTYAYFIVDQP